MKRNWRLVPYVLIGVLTLGTGLAVGLALSEGPVTAPSSDAAPSVIHCLDVVTGHTRVTDAEIASCNHHSFNTDAHCPKGHGITVVSLNKQIYFLQVGRLPSHFPSAERRFLGSGRNICDGQTLQQSTPFTFSSN